VVDVFDQHFQAIVHTSKQRHRLISATSKPFSREQFRVISVINFGSTENLTRADWVRSANSSLVLCWPLSFQGSFLFSARTPVFSNEFYFDCSSWGQKNKCTLETFFSSEKTRHIVCWF